jgi:hypothetical protein
LVEKNKDNNGGEAFPAPPFTVVINVVSYSVFGSDDCLLEEDSSHNIYVMVDVCLLLLLLYSFDKVVVVRNQRTLPVNVGC